MHKIAISLLSLILVTSAYAKPQAKPHKHHKAVKRQKVVVAPAAVVVKEAVYNDGFYVTAGGGFNDSTTELKRSNMGLQALSDKTKLGLSGAVGHAGFGWGKVFDSGFYSGLKGLFSLSSVQGKKQQENNPTIQQVIQLQQGYGINVMANFGVAVHNALPYLVLGGSYGKWQLSSASIAGSPLRVKTHRHRFGCIGGVGTDFALNQRLNVGLEYLYTLFDPIKLSHNTPVVGDVKVEPRTSSLNLMLKFKF